MFLVHIAGRKEPNFVKQNLDTAGKIQDTYVSLDSTIDHFVNSNFPGNS